MPDVVVVDWQTPEMRGDELLVLLARNRESRNLPVLFLSNIPRDDPQVMEAIVADQVVKSRTTPQDLANQLLVLLDGSAGLPHGLNS